jgi:hypothetical protein
LYYSFLTVWWPLALVRDAGTLVIGKSKTVLSVTRPNERKIQIGYGFVRN